MKTIFLLALATASIAQADILSDIARIRTVLPKGTDVAQIQIAKISGASEVDAVKSGENNYKIADFDKNGKADLAVLVEANPKLLIDYDESKPCDKIDYESGCRILAGARKLSIYMNGSRTPTFENKNIVLGADEGGVMGDPLQGVTMNSKGSIMLGFWGGSAWKWDHVYTIQFRRDNFYLVGYTDGGTTSLDGGYSKTDTNLLTGQQVKTECKSFEEDICKKTNKKLSIKPLVRLVNIQDRPQF